MANVVRESETLKINVVFVDGDYRTITLKDPKNTILASTISTLNTFIQQNNLLIGDKEGATFGKIKTVTRRTETKIHYDLT